MTSVKKLRVLVGVLGVLSSFAALGAQPIAISIGDEHTLLSTLMSKTEQSLSTLLAESGKYTCNDNSYVRFYDPKTNTNPKVAGRDVVIAVPSQLDYDTLMELLIKIRTARTLGAEKILVWSEVPLDTINLPIKIKDVLKLQTLISIAGADKVTGGNQNSYLPDFKPQRVFAKQPGYLIGGETHPQLLAQVSGLLGQNPLSFDQIDNIKDLKGQKIYWLAASTSPVNEMFFETLAKIQWMYKKGASVHLISPYLPYARSDKPEFDVGVTAQGRLAADLIEGFGAQAITVVRAHAPQSLGFFKIHATELSARKTLTEQLVKEEIDCIISPDAGFQKDATKYQHDLLRAYSETKPVCLAVMNKERDSKGKEEILGSTGLEHIEGKKVAIIDDETSSGGTLNKVSTIVKTHRPHSIIAVVTHLAGDGREAIHSGVIDKVIVTNTVPVKVAHPKLHVLSIASEIAEEIQSNEKNRL